MDLAIKKVERTALFSFKSSPTTVSNFAVAQHHDCLFWEILKTTFVWFLFIHFYLVVAVHSSIHSDVCKFFIQMNFMQSIRNWERRSSISHGFVFTRMFSMVGFNFLWRPEKMQKSMRSRRLPPSTPPLDPRSSGFWHSRSRSDWKDSVYIQWRLRKEGSLQAAS